MIGFEYEHGSTYEKNFCYQTAKDPKGIIVPTLLIQGSGLKRKLDCMMR
jgi:hypothetical protein